MKLKNIFTLLLTLFAFSCGDDDFPVPQSSSVDAKFSTTISNSGFAPADVTFTNESVLLEGTTPTYLWNFGDGTTSNEASPVHNYTKPGTYKVVLVATSSDDIDFIEKLVVIKDPDALRANLYVMSKADKRIYNALDGTSISIEKDGEGMDYDSTNQIIYFTETTDKTLMKVNLDGTGLGTVATGFVNPRDLALDIPNGKAYVADRGGDAIVEVSLSDGSKTTIYSNLDDATFLLPIGIDIYDGNLYATCVEEGAESVWKASTSGGGFTRIINATSGGYGYALAIDKINERIYFNDHQNRQILSSKLDGTDISTFATTTLQVFGISVDNINNKVYWSEAEGNSVYGQNIDGSGFVTITSDYGNPRGLFHIE